MSDYLKPYFNIRTLNNTVLTFTLEHTLVMDMDDLGEFLIPKDRHYTPKAKDKIFFDKECTVPRARLRGYLDNNKIGITRDQDKADAIFINLHSVKHCGISSYGYMFTSKDLFYILSKMNFKQDVLTEFKI